MAVDYGKVTKLVKEAKNKNEQACRELYDITYPKFYALAFSFFHNHQDTEDTVQEIYMKIFEKLEDLFDETSFIAWANRIAYHACINAQKQKMKDVNQYQPIAEGILEQMVDEREENDPYQSLESKEKYGKLQAYLSRLDPELRDVLVLKYIQQLKAREIAVLMECSVEVVKRRIRYAKRAMRELIYKDKNSNIFLPSFCYLPVFVLMKKYQAQVLAEIPGGSASAFVATPITIVGGVAGGITGVVGAVGLVVAVGTWSPSFYSVYIQEGMTNQGVFIETTVDEKEPLKGVFSVHESGDVYELIKTDSSRYTFQALKNGNYTLYVIGENGNYDTESIQVSQLDRKVPFVEQVSSDGKQIYIQVGDQGSGINYDGVYGEFPDGNILIPVNIQVEKHTVVFDHPEQDFSLVMEDQVGNVSKYHISLEGRR